jgi:curved DNA-binding protein CbpA
LGLKKSATESDIKKAYRSLALDLHPDKIPKNATEEERLIAKEKFLQIQEAYEVLSDFEKRMQHDLGQDGVNYDITKEVEHDRYYINPFATFIRTSRIAMMFQAEFHRPDPPSLFLPIYIDGSYVFTGYKGNYTYYRRVLCPFNPPFPLHDYTILELEPKRQTSKVFN